MLFIICLLSRILFKKKVLRKYTNVLYICVKEEMNGKIHILFKLLLFQRLVSVIILMKFTKGDQSSDQT